MNQTMTPSEKTMTTGQINKAVNQYRAMLEKHAFQFPAEPTQQALGDPGLAKSQFELFRTRVETLSDIITRMVLVDYDLTPSELLAAVVGTGRTPYVDAAVLAAMPRPMGMSGKREVRAKVFKPRQESYQKGIISGAALQVEYQYRNVIADPWLSFALNAADPGFADQHPNGVPWPGCYASFGRWGDKCGVNVNRSGGDWGVNWSFVGLGE